MYTDDKVLNDKGRIDCHSFRPVLFEFPTCEYFVTGEKPVLRRNASVISYNGMLKAGSSLSGEGPVLFLCGLNDFSDFFIDYIYFVFAIIARFFT